MGVENCWLGLLNDCCLVATCGTLSPELDGLLFAVLSIDREKEQVGAGSEGKLLLGETGGVLVEPLVLY